MKLPIEVRLIIWDFAREGRYIPFRPLEYADQPIGIILRVFLRPPNGYCLERSIPFLQTSQYVKQKPTWKFNLPSLLHTCQESRSFTLKTYSIPLDMLPHVYFDPEIDGLYLNAENVVNNTETGHLRYTVYTFPGTLRSSLSRILMEIHPAFVAWCAVSSIFQNIESILLVYDSDSTIIKNKKGIVEKHEIRELDTQPRYIKTPHG